MKTWKIWPEYLACREMDDSDIPLPKGSMGTKVLVVEKSVYDELKEEFDALAKVYQMNKDVMKDLENDHESLLKYVAKLCDELNKRNEK